MLPLQAKEDLGAMAMKGYTAFPKASALLEPHHKIALCHIQVTRWSGLILLQRCNRCILQPQPTALHIIHMHMIKCIFTYNSILVCFLNYINACTSAQNKHSHKNIWGGPRGVMVKAIDCGIVVSEFVLQSRYYVHFRANTLGKSMNPLILPSMG